MIQRIEENLSRQHKAMELLLVLLEEEFSRLRDRRAREITPVELSIQELMRQLAHERLSLRAMVQALDPSAKRVREVLPVMDEERAARIAELAGEMEETEQRCGIQANKNQQLALALFDQSTKLLGYMHKQISPDEDKNGYSAKGRYSRSTNRQAAILHGRL